MKKTFGRLIMAVLMIAVVLSVAAFAATTEYEPESDGTYSITYTGTAGTYYSMVVVEGILEEGATPTISEETVLYVGQQTADSTGVATFSGWTPKNDMPASVYVGKSDGVELIGYINNNMVKIYGTVSSSIPGGTKYEATVTVRDSNGDVVATTTSVNGEYSIYVEENVEYTYVFTMTNHNERQVTGTYAEDQNFNEVFNPAQTASSFVYGDAAYDYHGDGVTDYVDLMIAANVQCTGDGAAVTATYAYADGVITGTASDAQGFAVRQVLSIDKTKFNISDVKAAITLPANAVEKYYKETTSGNIVTVEVVYYNGTPSANIITINAPLADGVAAEGFEYNTFTVDSLAYANEAYNYYKLAGQTDNITVVNDLTAHVGTTTIPVVTGEKVYLQDGTVATMTSTGDYEIPAAKGYVVVNVGKENQRTYYLDGTTATQVHTDAVVGSDEHNLRDRTKTSDGEDKNGLRFKLTHNPETRKLYEGADITHRVVEVGFITTTNTGKVTQRLENANLPTDRNLITMEAVTVGAATSGAAYDWAKGIDVAFDVETDDAWDIRAVLYNIPITESGVQTVITARPYYKVGEYYLYGEATSASLAQVAAALKGNSNTWDACNDNMKAYINEILALAGNVATTNEEVIIDITKLFAALGLTA